MDVVILSFSGMNTYVIKFPSVIFVSMLCVGFDNTRKVKMKVWALLMAWLLKFQLLWWHKTFEWLLELTYCDLLHLIIPTTCSRVINEMKLPRTNWNFMFWAMWLMFHGALNWKFSFDFARSATKFWIASPDDENGFISFNSLRPSDAYLRQ